MHGGAMAGTGKRARIEIIPLIDIIFFLLATFIMVSLSMTKNQKEMEKALTLSVTERGDVFFNKEKIAMAQLPLKLQTYKATAKDPRVIVNGDAGAGFKYVVAVLDEVRKIGIAKVGINTDRK
jgi:biopolymer transport protein ExbD